MKNLYQGKALKKQSQSVVLHANGYNVRVGLRPDGYVYVGAIKQKPRNGSCDCASPECPYKTVSP
jgi:hypothetical protein